MPQKLPVGLSLLAGVALLSGCAANQPAAPVYNSDLTPEEQAAAFIGASNEKHARKIDRLAVTSCNVMFAATSSASASTRAGMFDNSNRAEASVSMVYTLKGIEDASLQKLADQICADAEKQLAAAGYELVPRSELLANESFKKLQEAGRSSPYEYKVGVSEYKVFARSDESVFDERYIGTASGLGQALRAAAGGAAWQLEGVTLEDLKASGANLNLMVDFASLSSNGQGGAIAGSDSAEVSGSVQLSVSGELALKSAEKLDCWNRFGKRECHINPNHIARYINTTPLVINKPFYSEVRDATSTGDKVASGVTTALSLLGGGTSRSVTRYEVDAIPAQYQAASSEGGAVFVKMASSVARSSNK